MTAETLSPFFKESETVFCNRLTGGLAMRFHLQPVVETADGRGEAQSVGVPGMGTGLEVKVLYGASW